MLDAITKFLDGELREFDPVAVWSKQIDGIAERLVDTLDLAQLLKDAERWRKLRASDWFKGDPLVVVNNSESTRSEKVFSGDRLDAAVDAMA